MKETSKAMLRRQEENSLRHFNWEEIFQGRMLDIGSGDDPLANAEPFDKEHGDANFLTQHFEKESFDLIHASHCLEHLEQHAADVLADWVSLLRPGGHLVFVVPDFGAYERLQYPSRFNYDHKSSWSMIYKGSPFPRHYHLPTLLRELRETSPFELDVRRMMYVERNYDWSLPPEVDQTIPFEAGVEILNEVVLKVLPF